MRNWLDRITTAAGWLVLPLALLLFAQWPLRDLLHAGSRQANDIAQWVFALYVALALRHATRADAHLKAPAVWHGGASPRLRRVGHALCVLPFALFVLGSGAPMAMESFPDTFNPGYFVIKCAAWLMALAMALQALLDMTAGEDAAS
jgi:TRAP-type mannitol/chloroaromatic compound transport system permease small subunit